MNTTFALLFLLGAAVLEAAGDAIVRTGLHGAAGIKRALILLLGGVVLLAYGCCVNAPRWDFGRLLGIYVCFFFLMAQAIAWFGFHQKPTPPIMIGGALIIAGGCVISFWKA